MKLSIVLATRNEEENIGRCLEAVKGIADEIVVVDEYSTDKTREIAKEYGAKVFKEPHHEIFHITKQKAIDLAKGDWILQLDADEVVTAELAVEIKSAIKSPRMWPKGLHRGEKRLLERHKRIVEKRDGKIGKETGEVVAFFIPRLNMFLGKPLKHAGVYPDGVIRLVKNGKARFPQKSVHEQMTIDGEVGWLTNPLEHYDSPTFSRYFARMGRYTDLHRDELKKRKASKNPVYAFYYVLVLPFLIFIKLYIRHKGILDGYRGFLWSFLSAIHYPVAYMKYMF